MKDHVIQLALFSELNPFLDGGLELILHILQTLLLVI